MADNETISKNDEKEVLLTKEQVNSVANKLKELTKRNAYLITINPQKPLSIFESKFGGLPYWDTSMEYPVDGNGEKMLLLAQICLDGLERLNNPDKIELPQKGMLQFFCGADDVIGADFDQPDSQKSFRVVYHKDIDRTMTEEKIRALGIPACTDDDMEEYTPVFIPVAVDVSVRETYIGFTDYRFDILFLEEAQRQFGIDTRNKSLYTIMDSLDWDELADEFCMGNHWMLAYPYFTQYDPREDEEDFRKYDMMLFQMDSEMVEDEEGWKDYVMWGDCGVANFFISGDALKKEDFSKVLYNWDCG